MGALGDLVKSTRYKYVYNGILAYLTAVYLDSIVQVFKLNINDII